MSKYFQIQHESNEAMTVRFNADDLRTLEAFKAKTVERVPTLSAVDDVSVVKFQLRGFNASMHIPNNAVFIEAMSDHQNGDIEIEKVQINAVNVPEVNNIANQNQPSAINRTITNNAVKNCSFKFDSVSDNVNTFLKKMNLFVHSLKATEEEHVSLYTQQIVLDKASHDTLFQVPLIWDNEISAQEKLQAIKKHLKSQYLRKDQVFKLQREFQALRQQNSDIHQHYKRFKESLFKLNEEIDIQNEEKEIYPKYGDFILASLFKGSLNTPTLDQLLNYMERNGLEYQCKWNELCEIMDKFVVSTMQRLHLKQQQKIANVETQIAAVSAQNIPVTSNNARLPREEYKKMCASQMCKFGADCHRGLRCWWKHTDEEKKTFEARKSGRFSNSFQPRYRQNVNAIQTHLHRTDESTLDHTSVPKESTYANQEPSDF